jgi:hypothetical protein
MGRGNAVDNGAISLLARTDSPNVCVGAARSPATLVAGVSSVPSNHAASPISRHRKRQDALSWNLGFALGGLAPIFVSLASARSRTSDDARSVLRYRLPDLSNRRTGRAGDKGAIQLN